MLRQRLAFLQTEKMALSAVRVARSPFLGDSYVGGTRLGDAGPCTWRAPGERLAGGDGGTAPTGDRPANHQPVVQAIVGWSAAHRQHRPPAPRGANECSSPMGGGVTELGDY